MTQPRNYHDALPSSLSESIAADPKIGALLVTYNPDISRLERLLRRLLQQVGMAVLVDNGSANVDQIRSLLSKLQSQPHLAPVASILNEENEGIAAAQNAGISLLLERECDLVVLSDQDSLPAQDMVERLQHCLFHASAAASAGDGAPVAAVGPVPVDARGREAEASSTLVYSFTKWGPKRRAIPGPHESLDVPFVLASGCMIPADVLLRVGPMNESLFIDHVDLAWCMRAVEMGYRILVCGDAKLEHSLGEDRLRLPGGRNVHVQSVARNYYMVRNTLFLTSAQFMPWRWKLGYMSYLAKYLGFYTLAGLVEPRRWSALAAGIRDGVSGRGGPRR